MAARARTCESCGHRAEGMKSRRSVGGGEGEPNDRKQMVADDKGLGALFSHPVFVGALLDANEEVGVIVGLDDGLRERGCR